MQKKDKSWYDVDMFQSKKDRHDQVVLAIKFFGSNLHSCSIKSCFVIVLIPFFFQWTWPWETPEKSRFAKAKDRVKGEMAEVKIKCLAEQNAFIRE